VFDVKNNYGFYRFVPLNKYSDFSFPQTDIFFEREKMKQLVCLSSIVLLFMSMSFSESPQVIEGAWVTYDDNDGKATSVVRLKVVSDTLIGIIDSLILDPNADPNPLCSLCQGDKKYKPMLKMQIVSNMKLHNNEWSGGKILDPKNGKSYRCIIYLKTKDVLVVRGYIGVSLIGRSQEWKRLK
jgi:uncharacterized protein (DUF2147 family)